MHFIPKHSLSQPLNGQEEEEEEDSVQELEAIGEVLSESDNRRFYHLNEIADGPDLRGKKS